MTSFTTLNTTHDEEASLRASAASERLDACIARNPDIYRMSEDYVAAARDRDASRIDATREPLMEALKAAGADYAARIEILRELQAEAMEGRQQGIRDTLVKQVAERHQGR